MGKVLAFIVVWVVRPIVGILIGRFVIEVLHSNHLYPEIWLAEKIVLPTPTQVQIDLVLWALSAAIGVALLAAYEIYMRRNRGSDDSPPAAGTITRTTWLNDINRQNQLVRKLTERANGYATLKIMFADMKHRPLADKLIAIFQLAGWRTTLANVPLESYIPRYHGGIEVKGYNSHLVENIYGLLNKSGLPDIRFRVEELQVPQDNPKWPFAQHTIKITIGHSE